MLSGSSNGVHFSVGYDGLLLLRAVQCDHHSLHCGESLVFLGRPGPLFVRFVGGSALGFHDIGSGASFGSLLK